MVLQLGPLCVFIEGGGMWLDGQEYGFECFFVLLKVGTQLHWETIEGF